MAINKHNVFISWSGDRSELIARAFFEWLPSMIQAVKPWMSRISIDKGSRSVQEITNAMSGARVGISCLTPENLTAPWILYEAGCLSKTIDDSTRLCTYLLCGLEAKDIEPPLAQFQHTMPTKEDTRALVFTINKAVGENISDNRLDRFFNKWWPDLEKKLHELPSEPHALKPRSLENMVVEILEYVRAETQRRSAPFYGMKWDSGAANIVSPTGYIVGGDYKELKQLGALYSLYGEHNPLTTGSPVIAVTKDNSDTDDDTSKNNKKGSSKKS